MTLQSGSPFMSKNSLILLTPLHDEVDEQVVADRKEPERPSTKRREPSTQGRRRQEGANGGLARGSIKRHHDLAHTSSVALDDKFLGLGTRLRLLERNCLRPGRKRGRLGFDLRTPEVPKLSCKMWGHRRQHPEQSAQRGAHQRRSELRIEKRR